MFNIREYRRNPQRLSDHLPWALLLDRGLILNKDGSFQTTIRFRGPDVESSTPYELMADRARLNNALRRFGSGWCLLVDSTRRPAHVQPPNTFPNPIAQRIEDERHQTLAESPGFESAYHLTLTFLPPQDHVRRVSGFLMTQPTRAAETTDSFFRTYLDEFNRQVDHLFNLLSSFMPSAHRLNDDETLSYLHDCVSERQLRVATPQIPCYLDAFLTDTPLMGGLSPRLGRQFLKVVSIRTYIGKSIPSMLNALNELALPFRWCARYLPMNKDQAEAEIKRIRRHWYARRKGIWTLIKEFITKSESALTETDSLNKADDATEALAELGADCCSYGHFTLTVTTWDAKEEVAERNAQSIQRVCDGLGLVSRIEDFNAVQAWFGSLPGHAYADVRRPIVSSLNLCDLMPFSSVWSGPTRNDYLDGPPLATVYTTGSTPFRLSLYQGDVGHTIVIGPTGSGKSTLLSFLACQWLRYSGAQVYIFDKGRSCRAMTYAMGGDFYDLAQDAASISFQPLASLGAEGESAWAHDWLLEIFQNERLEITPALKQELWSALANLATMPPNHRTLTTLTGLLQSEAMRHALHSYTLDGPYGHLLDADHDSLREASWQAFEMEGIMHSPALVPVLTYLFHQLERRFGTLADRGKPRPTLLILDEAWLFLANSTFASKIREWLKTLRKKHAAVLFATQSLADIAQSSIATAIIESCPTRIFLPNPAAFEQSTHDLYASFGLNDRQLSILQTAVPKRDYYYQSPAGNRLFQLGLGPVALAFSGAGSAKVQAILSRLYHEHGTEGIAAAYLQEVVNPPNIVQARETLANGDLIA